MSATYTVAPGQELHYPADAESLAMVQAAGGRRYLSAEDRENVRYKWAREGDDCSDLPQATLAQFIEEGLVLVNGTRQISANVEEPTGTDADLPNVLEDALSDGGDA